MICVTFIILFIGLRSTCPLCDIHRVLLYFSIYQQNVLFGGIIDQVLSR